MRKIVLLSLVALFMFSCNEDLQKKAEKLIVSEKTDVYINKPTFVFGNELTKLIDKERNEVIGYQMIYELKLPDYEQKQIATFDLKVENIISDDVYLEKEELDIETLTSLPEPPSSLE